MIGAGVTIGVTVVVGLVVPPTMVLAPVVALRIGAPKTLLASGEETIAFNLVVSFDRVVLGFLSSSAVDIVY